MVDTERPWWTQRDRQPSSTSAFPALGHKDDPQCVETLSRPSPVNLLFWPWEGSRQADGLVLVLVQLLWGSRGAC